MSSYYNASTKDDLEVFFLLDENEQIKAIAFTPEYAEVLSNAFGYIVKEGYLPAIYMDEVFEFLVSNTRTITDTQKILFK